MEVLEELKPFLQTDMNVIVRYGNGLKSLFNYPIEEDLTLEWNVTPVVISKSIYDTIIMKPKMNSIDAKVSSRW